MFIPKISGITQKISNQSDKKHLPITFYQQIDKFVDKQITHNEIKNFIKNILNKNIEIKSIWSAYDWGRIGNPLWGFKKSIKLFNAVDKNNSQYTDLITCYLDKNKNLKKLCIYDCNKKSIKLIDKNSKIINEYSPKETEAILTYKHSSTNIHKVLRNNKKVKDVDKIKKIITDLSNIFASGKAERASDEIIVYRALDKHSLKKIMSMGKNDTIFESPSFFSVATKKRKIFQFLNPRNFNHIMQIKIPKGTKYINLDEIGNAIVLQSAETELLLNKGSKFIIKNKKGYKGMIEAELIN